MSADKISPKPGKETIYIDVDDEITTIIDKVENAKQKIVALVLPKRATVLQSVVNMRLLKRRADESGKSVVLITSEKALLPLAGAAGIHVAKDLQSAPYIPPSPLRANDVPEPEVPAKIPSPEDMDEPPTDTKLDYHRSIGELAAANEEAEVISLADEDALPEPKEPKSTAKPQAKDKKIKVPNFERFRLMLVGGILAGVALIVFIIFAVFVLPKATITIQTASEPVSANLTLDASDKYTQLDEQNAKIPAVQKGTKQTSTQQVSATGQQNQGNKASGNVKLSNCTNSPVTIPSGTGISSGGLTYITQNSTSLDSGNFTSGGSCKSTGSHIGTVPVLAQKGGSNYNLASGATFSVAGYPGVSGTNTASFSGGTDNNVTVVSQQDVDNVKQKLTSGTSSDEFTKTFEKQLSDQGYYVLTSTLKVGDPQVTASPDVGQQATNTTVTANVTYSVLAIKKDDLRKILSSALNDQIDKTRQKLSSEDILKGASVSVQNQTGPGSADVSVVQDTTAIPIIDTAQVKKLAAGQKSGVIKSTISKWPGVKNVDVKLSPFWVSKTPKKVDKITVKLQQVKG